jgi:hypothetical protein
LEQGTNFAKNSISSRLKIPDFTGVFHFIQKQFIDQYQQSVSLVCIELASEIFIRVERCILTENHFQKPQECCFSAIPII